MTTGSKIIYENRQWTIIAMGNRCNKLMVTLQSDNGRVTMTLPYNDVVPLAQFIIPTNPPDNPKS